MATFATSKTRLKTATNLHRWCGQWKCPIGTNYEGLRVMHNAKKEGLAMPMPLSSRQYKISAWACFILLYEKYLQIMIVDW